MGVGVLGECGVVKGVVEGGGVKHFQFVVEFLFGLVGPACGAIEIEGSAADEVCEEVFVAEEVVDCIADGGAL
jgi:hypothetical protein